METPELDKLYLEISQFTSARTGREMGLERELLQALKVAERCKLEASTARKEVKSLKLELERASIKINTCNETIRSLRTWEK